MTKLRKSAKDCPYCMSCGMANPAECAKIMIQRAKEKFKVEDI